MSDIVERLLDYAKDDHERGCNGRQYDCSCGYDEKRDPLMVEAAKTIESLRSEVTQWVRHAKTAIWSDSEECKLLTVDNERLRAAADAAHAVGFREGSAHMHKAQGDTIATLRADIERLRAENDLLANDRDGYVALLTDQNNKLRAALVMIRDHEPERLAWSVGYARAALAQESPHED